MREGFGPAQINSELTRALTQSRDVRPVPPAIKISPSERKAAPMPDSTARAMERPSPDEEFRRELVPPTEEGGDE